MKDKKLRKFLGIREEIIESWSPDLFPEKRLTKSVECSMCTPRGELQKLDDRIADINLKSKTKCLKLTEELQRLNNLVTDLSIRILDLEKPIKFRRKK